MKKRFLCFALCIILVTLMSLSASAAIFDPYEGYNYNTWNSEVSAPTGYSFESFIDGGSLGIRPFVSPKDVSYYDGKLYILDQGNNAVVIVDAENYSHIKTIDSFQKDGEQHSLNAACGIYVGKYGILICDAGNERVILCGESGEVKLFITLNSRELEESNIKFVPQKALFDSAGNIYVLIKDFYYGAAIFDTSGRFNGFYGANRVGVSVKLLSDRVWRMFLSEKQISYLTRYLPVAYTSIDIDSENFLYTCTSHSPEMADQIKKLNNMGVDMLALKNSTVRNKRNFGDRNVFIYRGKWLTTSFIDIDVSDTGFITALDSADGKVFMLDQDSNLAFVFGGLGNQKGLFTLPVAVENVGSKVAVLDEARGGITMFTPSVYGELLRSAVEKTSDGLYSEAAEYWREVIKFNSNYEPAYAGVGRVLLEEKKYSESLSYFKMGYDREGYSEAYKFVRADYLKGIFPFIAIFLVLLIVWVFVKDKVMSLYYKKTGRVKKELSPQTPFHIAVHPFEGFDELRRCNRLSVLIASLGVVLLWFVATIVSRQSTGFIFNYNRLDRLEIGFQFVQTFAVAFLFVICNWAISTLFNGEGNLRRIMIVSGYSLLPYVISIFVNVILSNVLILDEAVFMTLITTVGLLWTGLLLWNGLKEIHQYSGFKMLGNVLLTILGMMFVLFIVMLFFGLAQQFFIFIASIFNELSLRGL